MALQLHIMDDQVLMYNGLLQLTLTNPGGHIIAIQYNGIDNLLELHNPELNGGFWDLNWSEPESTSTSGKFDMIEGTIFEVIVQNEEQVELSFKRIWDSSLKGEHAPLNIDKRFIMLRGSSGFYSYAIYEHLVDMPSLNLNETRMAFMLKKEKFHYMAMADNRQRFMPLPDDRLPGRGEELAYPEAVLLVNPVEPEFIGEVDDKYQYMCENKDNKVHGWICLDPPVGFWQITPSNEFRTGGPLKQNQFKSGEPWKKVFGPVFIYLNSASDNNKVVSLWDDAKEQMKTEVQSWPYEFPSSEDFPHPDQRGSLSVRLLVDDRYISDYHIVAGGAYVGLAPPGEVGSFQRECKVLQGLESASNCVEDMDEWLGIFNVKLRHMREDIELRMNVIRIRKENQVYSAEDKRALAMFNYEEKAKREQKVMADLQRLVQRHNGEDTGPFS